MSNWSQADEWWEENVESGAFDEATQTDDGTPESLVFLSYNDLLVVHEALRRYFVSVKKARMPVLHATHSIRRAMREILEEEE